MKQQLSLVQLAQELERQAGAKRDFIATSPSLKMQDDGATIDMPVNASESGTFGLREHAHGQLAAKLEIPKRYYDRMRREAPDLLARNANHWLQSTADRRMVRTMDGEIRAILSDRYQRIENDEIAQVTLPVLAEQTDMQVVSTAITETRLYIKAVFPRCEGEIAKGDVVQSGVVISNSEVGAAAVSVTPLVYRLVCTNGMILPDQRLRGFHVGARAAEGEAVYEMLSDETKRADDRAILLKVRDIVRMCADPSFFATTIEKMRDATQDRITGDPVKAVEALANKARLLEGERTNVLRHLIEGGQLSRYGLLNAVTRASQDVADYDRATDLEALGGQVLTLPKSEWRVIAEAA